MPVTSARLNGFQQFTVDVAAKHIGKPINLYCREFKDAWPKRNAWSSPSSDATHTVMQFVPTGDAIREKTTLPGWLKTRQPPIRPGTHFYLDGPLSLKNAALKNAVKWNDRIQVDSRDGKIVSYNLLNTEVFVKDT